MADEVSRSTAQAASDATKTRRAIEDASLSQAGAVREVREAAEWGLSLLFEQGEEQAEWLAQISRQLDGIARALRSPQRTRCRELVRAGNDLMLRGHFRKALERFEAALVYDDTDFHLQLLLGKLLLYGRNARESVVDVARAVGALESALDYSLTERKAEEAATKVRIDAQRHLGIGLFVAGTEASVVGAE
ncbi:hypothetical protein, partial [Longimicrobium sp.]|uniref:hypothetical protein n=1 Tax=Longimicrobium sp. TaxID=2029185 RepID=UPI002F92A1E3